MPRSFPKLLSSPSLPPLCSQAAAGLLSITVLLEVYINGVIQPMHFSVWLLSLSNVISRVTHVVAHIAISFFLIQSMAVPHTRVVRLSIALWMDIWAIRLGTITHRAVMNICVQVFVETYAFTSLE